MAASKRRLELGRMFVKSSRILMEIDGMTRQEKEDRCIGNETVEEWQERLELIQYDVIELVIKE